MNIGDVLRSTPLEICLTEDSVPVEGRLYGCYGKTVFTSRCHRATICRILHRCPFCGAPFLIPHQMAIANYRDSNTYECGTSITITDGTCPGDIDVIVNEIKFDILHVGSERMIQCLSGLDDVI